MTKYDKLTIFFHSLDKKYLHKIYDDVSLWELVRIDVYDLMLSHIASYDYSNSQFDYKHLITNGIALDLKKFFTKDEQVSILIIESDKKRSIEDDPFTNKLCVDDYLVISNDSLKTKNHRYNYSKSLSSLVKMYFNTSYEYLSLVQNIQDEIYNEYAIECKLDKIMRNRLVYHKINYKSFKKELKRLSPDKIYVSVGYYKEYMIQAAHDLNIDIFEIQHACLDFNHIAYSFGEYHNREYKFDKLIVFDDYWLSTINCDALNIEVDVDIIDKKAIELPVYNRRKIEYDCLYLSQWGIDEVLLQYAMKQAKQGKKIAFKLHPNTKHKIMPTIEGIDYFRTSRTIYDLASVSKVIYGASSTALFDVLPYNKNIYIFKDLCQLKTLYQDERFDIIKDVECLDE